jgi:Tfp pilus assembly protein PilN
MPNDRLRCLLAAILCNRGLGSACVFEPTCPGVIQGPVICDYLIPACILPQRARQLALAGRGTSVVNTNINLASRPFNNRLLPWLMTAVVLFISIIGLLIVVRFTFAANQQAAVIQKDIDQLKEQEKGIVGEAEKVKESLTGEQLQALQGAHQLVDRKEFSWSRLLADLEASLPGTVRVSRIAVRDVVAQTNQTVAELDLVVFAKNSNSITDMIAEMDKAGIFQAELRAQNLQKGRGESGTEYELFVVYRPRSGVATERIAEIRNHANTNEGSK